MKERRRFRRYDSDFPAKVELLSNTNVQSYSAELSNISAGGAYAFIDGVLAPDSKVDLVIPDYENTFGRHLGLDLGRFPFNLIILSNVIRTDRTNRQNGWTGVAFEFTSAVRMAPLSNEFILMNRVGARNEFQSN